MCSKIIYFGVILLLTPIGFIKGSCLEYGHSCWGAHGKRSTGKIYRSIDGSENQQTQGKRDIDPSELLNMFLGRNPRVNLDEATNSHDFKSRHPKEDEDQLFDASKQQLKRKLRDAFRKGIVFHYSPSESEEKAVEKTSQETESKPKRHLKPALDTDHTKEDSQMENYPIINLDMEYLDLK